MKLAQVAQTPVTEGPGPHRAVCVRCRHVFFNEFVYLWLCRVFMLCGLFSSCGEQGLLSLGAGGA